MDAISTFLSNPLVALTGYAFSLVAAVIAIWQFWGKSKALKELDVLKVKITNISEENTNLQSIINNKNRVQQGGKSQYFQENSGSINIDNRG